MFNILSFESGHCMLNGESTRSFQPPRSRRQQVARACTNCRAYRIKCDDSRPCFNCRRKGKACGNEGSIEIRTYAGAVREIERLNKRIQELEQLLRIPDSTDRNSAEPIAGVKSNRSNLLPRNLDPLLEHGGNKKSWESIQLDTEPGTTQCFGPASICYFITRMNIHLTGLMPDSNEENQVEALTKQLRMVSNTDFESNLKYIAGPINGIYMERSYEEFYLNIFWKEYHPLYPIIDEIEFWNYHRSLWDKSQRFRRASALVDAILAICLQHGATWCPISGRCRTLADKNDEIIASRWFYRRCQTLLTNQLETPSISILQSYMLTVIYLSHFHSQNAAYSLLAIAIRIGIILGLHLEPQEHLPEQQREARKRLWWLLYALEMKFAMELGRPLAVNISEVTCSLPSDEVFAYSNAQQQIGLSKQGSFLSFAVHFVRLVLATRAIYIMFYDKCARFLGQNKQRSIYEKPEALEECANFLETQMQYIQKWMHDVPVTLKVGREAAWGSCSTDDERLAEDASTPHWQRQQSIFLELHYQNMIMSLYRPFICFSRPRDLTTPIADRCAGSCLSYARSMTSMVYQTLRCGNILDNHYEAFRWQWNATMTLVGYMIAYPATTEAMSAVEAIHVAIQVFERLGESLAIALQAKHTTEEALARLCSLGEAGKSHGSAQTLLLPLGSEVPRFLACTQDLMPLQGSSDMEGQGEEETSTTNVIAEVSDLFAWARNQVDDDLFDFGRMAEKEASSSWPLVHSSRDEELLGLFSGDYGGRFS
ncbi:uncharacterized protein PV09_08809 [Verruconis gallopava]|uniref:Zn(2)-C6 fungal-type domain-containing protein n=1 Tax=Verruconis gallopava TaxID=253628 RepID=A0A0D1ZZS5_9PEZI|nr:uncharacterized protein PV09_08809 [Verruconis gallopava]KIV99504.1 hypothetical protein PV09_08809 [Verruconis gallopava]